MLQRISSATKIRGHHFLRCIFLSFIVLSLAAAQSSLFPKREVRAVWLTTAGGADWPASFNAEEQKRSLIQIFNTLQKENFNTVFFQVRPRGNAFYRSSYEPWAAELTGTLGKDPGWDPLAFAIDEAHRRGMELHAWFNVAKVYGEGMPPVSSPRHIVRAHPEWVQQYNGEWWVDMGIPNVRTYTENIVMELVRKYNLDGIHFDYIRYPGEKFNDWSSFRAFGGGMNRDDWRRNNITTFVRDMYREITAEKPMMKVGSAPLGVYTQIPGASSGFAGYSVLYQDSRLWLREGIHDYLAPQIYWSFGEQSSPNDPDFRALCIDWARNNFGRHIYIGIGAYRENVRSEILEQIFMARSTEANGEAFFRYENIADMPSLVAAYKYPALIPPMPWKDCIPPLPPENIRVSEPQPDLSLIQWTAPPAAADGDTAWRYVIYRSTSENIDTDNPRAIAAVVPATETRYIDRTSNTFGMKLYYTVTALDRGNNESVAPTLAGTAFSVSEKASNKAEPASLWLAQNYPNPFFTRTYISYKLNRRMPVELVVSDTAGRTAMTLVRETQNPGTYIVSVDAADLSEGKYIYRLKAGSFIKTKYMVRGE
ncbi:MAG: family 10 glycosylhydrolase [Bacteroidota bacterium]|nr:family 10 glycosylhydrolase [Bacteroidota bacterium]